jgi:predicted alternative tryptophan synthase beta-subunit
MTDSTQYLLPEDRIPRRWYNIQADLPKPLPAVCTRARCSRWAPTTSRRSSRWR